MAPLILLTLSAKHFITGVEFSGRVIGLSTVRCSGRYSWRPLCPLCPSSAVWSQALQTLCWLEQHRAVHHHTLRNVLRSTSLHCCNYCHLLALVAKYFVIFLCVSASLCVSLASQVRRTQRGEEESEGFFLLNQTTRWTLLSKFCYL